LVTYAFHPGFVITGDRACIPGLFSVS